MTEATRVPLIPGTIWDRIGWTDQIKRNSYARFCQNCGSQLPPKPAPAQFTNRGILCSPCSRRARRKT